MGHNISSFSEEYEWVKVKGKKRFNIQGDRRGRPWTNGRNVSVSEGEELILPRGRKNGSGYAEGMEFYFTTGEFFEVVDPNVDVNAESSAPEEDNDENVSCTECDRKFSTSKGMKQHRRQKHETDKNEDEGE